MCEVSAATSGRQVGGSDVKKKSSSKAILSFALCLNAPFRALRRARDAYVRRLAKCAGAGGGAPMTGYTAGMAVMMRRGRSTNAFGGPHHSRDEDIRELVRTSSAAAAARRLDKEEITAVPRCQSAPVIGRIEEERSLDDDGSQRGVEEASPAYPRSQSAAVAPARRQRMPTVVE